MPLVLCLVNFSFYVIQKVIVLCTLTVLLYSPIMELMVYIVRLAEYGVMCIKGYCQYSLA